MSLNGLIYKAENLINGKKYIGQTIQTLRIRKLSHMSSSKRGSDLALHRSIRKYGYKNFKWNVIEKNIKDKNILNERERYYIKYYNSFGKNGYNMDEGGTGCFKLLDLDLNEIKRLFIEENLSFSKIGKVFNVDGYTIKKRLNSIGIYSDYYKDLSKYKNEIINLFENGISLKKIAKRFDVSRPLISKFLKDEGIYKDRRNIKINPNKGKINIDMELAKKLFKEGNSCCKIGEYFNVSSSTILNRFKEVNFDISQKIKINKRDIIKCFDKRMLFKDIAKFFGISVVTLRQRCIEYGIKYGEYFKKNNLKRTISKIKK